MITIEYPANALAWLSSPFDPQLIIRASNDGVENLPSGQLRTELKNQFGVSTPMNGRLVLSGLSITPSSLNPDLARNKTEWAAMHAVKKLGKSIVLTSSINLHVHTCYGDGDGGYVFKYKGSNLPLKIRMQSAFSFAGKADYYEYQTISADDGYFRLKKEHILSLWKGLSIGNGGKIAGSDSSGRASIPYTSKNGSGTATFAFKRFL